MRGIAIEIESELIKQLRKAAERPDVVQVYSPPESIKYGKPNGIEARRSNGPTYGVGLHDP